jgi:hypothetical protein
MISGPTIGCCCRCSTASRGAAAGADRDRRHAHAADILVQLGIPEDGLIVAGFDRPNIRYHVRPRDGVAAS